MKEPEVDMGFVENFNDLGQYLLQEWGRDGRVPWGVQCDMMELGKRYGKDKLYRAIKIAAQANVRSYRYVYGILQKEEQGKSSAKSIGQVAQSMGFVEILCCVPSIVARKIDLVNNAHRMWKCTKCGKTHAVQAMLDKVKDGKIILITQQPQDGEQ